MMNEEKPEPAEAGVPETEEAKATDSSLEGEEGPENGEEPVDETPTLVLLGLLALLGIAALGYGIWYFSPERTLRRTAVNYANTLNGHREGEILQFWSPPMREKAQRTTGEDGSSSAEMINKMLGARSSQFSMPEVSGEELSRVVIRGRFGWTEFLIPPGPGGDDPQRLQFRWVRDGLNWYRFQGFAAETEVYGDYQLEAN